MKRLKHSTGCRAFCALHSLAGSSGLVWWLSLDTASRKIGVARKKREFRII